MVTGHAENLPGRGGVRERSLRTRRYLTWPLRGQIGGLHGAHRIYSFVTSFRATVFAPVGECLVNGSGSYMPVQLIEKTLDGLFFLSKDRVRQDLRDKPVLVLFKCAPGTLLVFVFPVFLEGARPSAVPVRLRKTTKKP